MGHHVAPFKAAGNPQTAALPWRGLSGLRSMTMMGIGTFNQRFTNY
jgi:hypothetical protein